MHKLMGFYMEVHYTIVHGFESGFLKLLPIVCIGLSHSRRCMRWCGSKHTGIHTTGEALLAMATMGSGRASYHRRGCSRSAMVGSHRGAYHSER